MMSHILRLLIILLTLGGSNCFATTPESKALSASSETDVLDTNNLTTRLYAVHIGFGKGLPADGMMVPDDSPGHVTTHFTLNTPFPPTKTMKIGKNGYVVILPVSYLLPQTLAISFPELTALGPVYLDPELTHVVAPKSDEKSIPSHYKNVTFYDDTTALVQNRDAAARSIVHKLAKGLVVDLKLEGEEGNWHSLTPAMTAEDKENLNTQDFFAKIMNAQKGICFGVFFDPTIPVGKISSLQAQYSIIVKEAEDNPMSLLDEEYGKKMAARIAETEKVYGEIQDWIGTFTGMPSAAKHMLAKKSLKYINTLKTFKVVASVSQTLQANNPEAMPAFIVSVKKNFDQVVADTLALSKDTVEDHVRQALEDMLSTPTESNS